MNLDVILTARRDRPVTRGPISGRLDLSHYRMWARGDRLSGPRHSVLHIEPRGGGRLAKLHPELSERRPRPHSAMWFIWQRRPAVWKFSSAVCNEACYRSPL